MGVLVATRSADQYVMSSKEERVASPAFKFKVGELVLVKWEDGMVYFAKIKKIDEKRSKCVVIFDDKSQDDADFAQIHSGKFTTNAVAFSLLVLPFVSWVASARVLPVISSV